ncbi:hypothetical protein EU519_00325 [Candidatus Thorarchaeota archaeon]|nr:MAG: hypothetical protein EU519_00325 [Candidatus Thorarchaeota archaeon]
MAIRIKESKLDAIEETETKGLMMLTITEKSEGLKLALELPEALATQFSAKEKIDVVIDDSPISNGDEARFYAEGNVFKARLDEEVDVVGTLGGLRLVVEMDKVTAAKERIFTADRIYLALF